MVEALFKAYFEDGSDITSHEVLKNAAVDAGLPEQQVTDVLQSDDGGAVVDKEAGEARANGVNGGK